MYKPLCSSHVRLPDRRATHRAQCSLAISKNLHPNDITLKLAERFIVDPYLRFLLTAYSILSLDLLNNGENIARFAVNIACTTRPADIMAFGMQLASSQGPDPNAPIRFVVSSIQRVPLQEIPPSVQKTRTDFQKDPALLDPATNTPLPLLTLYFSCVEGYGQHRREIVTMFPVEQWELDCMANKPKITNKSSIFGETELDMDMPMIIE